MGHIIAIGGGEMGGFETLSIDRHIVESAGKKKPNLLFIPTASDDAPDYCDAVNAIYGKRLGCQVDNLLLSTRPTYEDIQAKIEWADCIYVGGGNTLKMMTKWRKLGIDKLMEQAYVRGVVLSGLSAGAICWFAYGHSDSRSFTAKDGTHWNFIRVRALGLVNLIFCPHLFSEDRFDDFQQLMSKNNLMGIGVDDNAALEIKDDQWRIITSQKGAQAFRFYRQQGTVMTEELTASETFQPLTQLLNP